MQTITNANAASTCRYIQVLVGLEDGTLEINRLQAAMAVAAASAAAGTSTGGGGGNGGVSAGGCIGSAFAPTAVAHHSAVAASIAMPDADLEGGIPSSAATAAAAVPRSPAFVPPRVPNTSLQGMPPAVGDPEDNTAAGGISSGAVIIMPQQHPFALLSQSSAGQLPTTLMDVAAAAAAPPGAFVSAPAVAADDGVCNASHQQWLGSGSLEEQCRQTADHT